MAGITCFCLLMRKNYSLLFKYALVMLASALFLFVVFPPAWDVLLFSPRSQKSMGTFNYELDEGIISFLVFLDNQFSVSYRAIVAGLLEFNFPFSLLLLLAIFYLVIAIYERRSSTIEMRWLTILFFIMFFFLVLIMPNMADFHLRYFMFLMPLAAILFVRFAYEVLACVHLPDKWILRGFWLFLVGALLWHNIVYAYPRTVFNHSNTAQTVEFFDKIKNKNVVMVSGLSWMALFASTYYLNGVHQVYYVYEEPPLKVLDKADFVLYINRGWSNTVGTLPTSPRNLPLEYKQKLEYVSGVNLGWNFFDFYKVVR